MTQSDARSRLAALAKADKTRAAKAAPKSRKVPQEAAAAEDDHEPRLTSVAIPAALLTRLRRLALSRTEDAGQRVAPWKLIAEALDLLETRDR